MELQLISVFGAFQFVGSQIIQMAKLETEVFRNIGDQFLLGRHCRPEVRQHENDDWRYAESDDEELQWNL